MNYDLTMPLGRATVSELLARVSDLVSVLATGNHTPATTAATFDKFEADQATFRPELHGPKKVAKAAAKKGTRGAHRSEETLYNKYMNHHASMVHNKPPLTVDVLYRLRVEKFMPIKDIAAKYDLPERIIRIKLHTMPHHLWAKLAEAESQIRSNGIKTRYA